MEHVKYSEQEPSQLTTGSSTTGVHRIHSGGDGVVLRGGGGFFLACEDLGRMFEFPACAIFFFLKWRLGRAH